MILQNQSGYISRRTKSRISKSYLYTCIQSSIVHSSQKVRATQVSGGGWRNKQNVAETHSGRTALREGNSGTCYNIEEMWRHHAQWNKPDAKGQILYDSSYTKSLDLSNPERLEVECWLPGAGGWGMGSSYLLGMELLFGKMFCSCRRWLHTKWMCLMSVKCTLINGWNSKFYVAYISPQKFLKAIDSCLCEQLQ